MPAREKKALGEFDDLEKVSDSDSNLLSGVPLKASGGEDALTLGDIAVETPVPSKEDDSDSGMPSHDFEFNVVQSEPSPPPNDRVNEPQDAPEQDDSEFQLNDLDVDDDPLKDAAADLNQLLGTDDRSENVLNEKGTFGISCPTCDSRLLVGLRQVGEETKCGDCYSMVKVRPPTSAELRQIEKQIAISEKDQPEKTGVQDWNDDVELQLAPLEELSEDEVVDDGTLLTAELLTAANGNGSEELSDQDESDEEFGELKLEDLPEGVSDPEKGHSLDVDRVMPENSLAEADSDYGEGR